MENITRSQRKLKVETSEQRELWKSRVSKSYLALVSKPVEGFQQVRRMLNPCKIVSAIVAAV